MAAILYKRVSQGQGAAATPEEVAEASAAATTEAQGAMSAIDKNKLDEMTFLAGNGVPSDDNGLDGYFYLNLANGNVYTKASGTWSLSFNLVGVTGYTGWVHLPDGNYGYFTNGRLIYIVGGY